LVPNAAADALDGPGIRRVPIEFQHALNRGFGFERIKSIMPPARTCRPAEIHREQDFFPWAAA
jgi:hypothetical protein